MSELKPCPFCGGEATQRDFTSTSPFPNGWVGCQKCHCTIDWIKAGKPMAVAAWNRRAKSANVPLTLDDAAATIQVICANGGCPPEKHCAIGNKGNCHDCLKNWLKSLNITISVKDRK